MHSVVPIRHNGKLVYAVVLHGDGIQRIQSHDPAVIEMHKLQQSFDPLGLYKVDILLCYEENMDEFLAKVRELKDGSAVLKYLARNWENRPGDTFADGGNYKVSDVSVTS